MKLNELKCKNCGASINNISNDAKTVTCEFCHTTYEIETLEDNAYQIERGKIRAQDEAVLKFFRRFEKMDSPKFMRTPLILFIIFFIILIGIWIFSFSHVISDFMPKSSSSYSQFDINSFNNTYEVHAGRATYSKVESVLTNVITNNKTNSDHIIKITYKDISTDNVDEITNLKNSLSSDSDNFYPYDISFNYDQNKFINEVVITDL